MIADPFGYYGDAYVGNSSIAVNLFYIFFHQISYHIITAISYTILHVVIFKKAIRKNTERIEEGEIKENTAE